jgi:type III secretion system chaperone SycN
LRGKLALCRPRYENEMDLQTERRLEQFARLAELPVKRMEPRMEFTLPPLRLYVEAIDDRVLLTLALPIEAVHRAQVLKNLLRACNPYLLQGVPLRAYCVRDIQLLSCAPARHSDGSQWLDCYRTMCRLLETHARSRS